jgi:polysaccharide export outer membrane protein
MRFFIHSVFKLTLCLLAAATWLASQEPEKKEPSAQAPPAAENGTPEAKPVVPNAKPGPDLPIDPRTYVIGPEDVLFVQVWREQDLTRQVLVRPDGKITLPLAGEMQAAGLTPQQLGENITEGLSKFMIKPDVMVSLQSSGSKKYFVTGEVNRSGSFPLVVPTTIMEALSSCGFREFANEKNITIIRAGGSQRLKFNYSDYVKGKGKQKNILLENGDIVVVK